MTTQQPEALRLAEYFELFKSSGHLWHDGQPLHLATAAELRRLSAINAQLLEALEECVEDSETAVEYHISAYGEKYRPERLRFLREVVSNARAAIAAAKEQA